MITSGSQAMPDTPCRKRKKPSHDRAAYRFTPTAKPIGTPTASENTAQMPIMRRLVPAYSASTPVLTRRTKAAKAVAGETRTSSEMPAATLIAHQSATSAAKGSSTLKPENIRKEPAGAAKGATRD